jgi:dihydrodipicolinate synthase/N-acetylneuraminate lyase
MMAAMGRPVGPTRPPTLPMDAAEVAELRQGLIKLDWTK